MGVVRVGLVKWFDPLLATPFRCRRRLDLPGQLLSQILHTHPHLLPAAAEQQLEQLHTEKERSCDAANCVRGSCTELPKLIPDVPNYECHCDPGWSQAWKAIPFSPCVIPNAELIARLIMDVPHGVGEARSSSGRKRKRTPQPFNTPVLEGVDLNTKAPEVEQVHSFEDMQGVSLDNWRFSQEVSRKELTRMISLHGLPLWKHWYACKIGCEPQGASGLGDHQPAAIGSNGKFADFSSIVIRMVFQELGMDLTLMIVQVRVDEGSNNAVHELNAAAHSYSNPTLRGPSDSLAHAHVEAVTPELEGVKTPHHQSESGQLEASTPTGLRTPTNSIECTITKLACHEGSVFVDGKRRSARANYSYTADGTPAADELVFDKAKRRAAIRNLDSPAATSSQGADAAGSAVHDPSLLPRRDSSSDLKRDFTWVHALGVNFGAGHRLYAGARRAVEWDEDEDHIQITFDAEPIDMDAVKKARWVSKALPGLSVTRMDTVNTVMVELDGVFSISANAVPITGKDNWIHRYDKPEGDSLVHLDLGFQFHNLTKDADACLGRPTARFTN
ncbi:hypothetical protein C2845_PM04G07440 [Panicum miliaceum]|uniref:Uncharacterized protein n=1 Tax=Panicum miliaceum TaxID=4540 RepID=A0A3L6QX28_PANMI|nr:hypothetical protein C2845_PM04G07440 [Panicum miliaceum]